MMCPELAHNSQGVFRQRYKAIFSALAASNMNAVIVSIDITQLQIKRLRQSKSKRVGDDNKHSVAQLPGAVNEELDFG